jgi:hypothetical protein
VASWSTVLDLFKSVEDMDTEARAPAAGGTGRSSQRGIVSPWQTGELSKVAWADIFGVELASVSIGEAMRCAPVKKGRALLHSLIGTRPLRQYDAGTGQPATNQPRWLSRTDTRISPQLRLKRMLDDHLFYDATLLVVKRGTPPANGGLVPILDAVHCPYDRWRIDDDGVILVDEQPAWDDAVVWIPGPSAGLLAEAADEIREWRAMRDNMGKRLANPTPFFWLEDTDESTTKEDAQAYVDSFNTARQGAAGGTAYVPAGMAAHAADPNDDHQLYIEGRNGLRLDIANHFNLPASLFEGSLATASLTYSTAEGKRNEVSDYGLGYWTDPIEAALSLDNVSPRGSRIRIDFTDLYAPTNAPAGAITED